MSSTDPIPCLFCQHINPAGSSFCNRCAAQLSLQPCLHCDAVDNRTATRCYKCGTPLPVHQMPEPDAEAEPGALDTAQTPPALGHAIVVPVKEVLVRRDLIPGPTVIERSYGRNGSEIVTTAAGSRRGWLVSGTAFLLVLLAVSAYLYSRQSGKDIQTAETQPLVQAETKAPVASAMASQEMVAVTPVDTPRPATVGANEVGKALRAAPSSVGIPSSVQSSSEDAEVVKRRVPLPRNECAPAVATLGLCEPEAGQEKP